MDYIKEFDIRLEREQYYAGEILAGRVILSTSENFKLKGKILFLFYLHNISAFWVKTRIPIVQYCCSSIFHVWKQEVELSTGFKLNPVEAEG